MTAKVWNPFLDAKAINIIKHSETSWEFIVMNGQGNTHSAAHFPTEEAAVQAAEISLDPGEEYWFSRDYKRVGTRQKPMVGPQNIRIKALYPNSKPVMFRSTVPSDWEFGKQAWARLVCDHKGLTLVAVVNAGKRFS
jgi:hypothetical protein